LLDTYTTTVTDVLDLGPIVPTLVVAAVLVRRRAALGHVLAAALIVLLVLIAATIAGPVLQLRAGEAFTAGQVVGPIADFLVLGAVGVVLLRLLRDVPAADALPQPRTDGAERASPRLTNVHHDAEPHPR
jgi:hypothetical protein